jgi:AbrB family looped-hinge helix DNA binding protein
MQRSVSKVTRKGQITIPVELRRRYKIAQGSYVELRDDETRILVKPIPDLLDLVGADSGKYDAQQMKRELDRSRQKWR